VNYNPEIEPAKAKILDFMGFFLSLGDMKGPDMLMAVAERDPGFGDYVETVTEPLETAVDFFRVYAQYVFTKMRGECGPGWAEACEACTVSERYRLMEMQWKDVTLLWGVVKEEVEKK